MAFKSLAQMRKCQELVALGTMTQEKFDQALAETDVDTLPERIHPKQDKPEAAGKAEG